ncbi:hypothetical protein [Bifidobacterium platyrrhinorum]|uniref:Lipoprotein n=1 Tax=Bifidobacterium platyrrhinorum TaxID=2661628 RepID=A0A6L9SXU6_9BIFI|nr:hypothetical protein [Bifidobacterium platyrrhinorum]NEG55951.1 hypothetical protein [Bifidobacterium platyrrhinorum]
MGAAAPSRLAPRLVASAAAVAMALSLAGCTAPHLESLNADASKPGTCESAYLSASAGSGAAAASSPLMMRYLAARTAADAWITVASSCTSRFAEGAMRSAQASYRAQTLGTRLGAPDTPTPSSVDYGEVVHLDVDRDALDAMSLAEDRAGFGLEVLAARGVANATLSASDNHKTAAQRLFSLSGSDKDPRRKVYAVDRLIAHPDVIADPATGVTANTVAVIEMNCARAYLDALGGDEDADADAAGGSAASDDAVTGSSPTKAVAASTKSLDWLARMASARAWHAMELGYPTADALLFD